MLYETTHVHLSPPMCSALYQPGALLSNNPPAGGALRLYQSQTIYLFNNLFKIFLFCELLGANMISPIINPQYSSNYKAESLCLKFSSFIEVSTKVVKQFYVSVEEQRSIRLTRRHSAVSCLCAV